MSGGLQIEKDPRGSFWSQWKRGTAARPPPELERESGAAVCPVGGEKSLGQNAQARIRRGPATCTDDFGRTQQRGRERTVVEDRLGRRCA